MEEEIVMVDKKNMPSQVYHSLFFTYLCSMKKERLHPVMLVGTGSDVGKR